MIDSPIIKLPKSPQQECLESIKKCNRGDVVKVFRKLIPIWHYGVVTGEDEVVHFRDGLIIKTDFEVFIKGDYDTFQKCNLSETNRLYNNEKTAQRAESCVGTDFGGYDFLNNNCEHFANWCISGDKYSTQVFIKSEEEHSVLEKVAEKAAEPILDGLEKACDSMDKLQEKTDAFFEKLMDIKDKFHF